MPVKNNFMTGFVNLHPLIEKIGKMKAIKGIFLLLLFYFLGEIFAHLIGGVLPGSVLGMLLLFVALQAKWVDGALLEGPVGFLMDNMALFFIPVGVGLIACYDLLADNLWAIVVSILLSTLIVMLTVGFVVEKIGKKK